MAVSKLAIACVLFGCFHSVLADGLEQSCAGGRDGNGVCAAQEQGTPPTESLVQRRSLQNTAIGSDIKEYENESEAANVSVSDNKSSALKTKRAKSKWGWMDWSGRRRSLYEKSSCNNEPEIPSSEFFTSCHFPHMENSGNRKWGWWGPRTCKCQAGYQQGPDNNHGQHEICVPCGCMNLASYKGYQVDICPPTYEAPPAEPHWITSTQAMIDNLTLPTMGEMESQWYDLNSHFSDSVSGIKSWMSDSTQDGIQNVSSSGSLAVVELRQIRSQALVSTGTGMSLELQGIWDSIRDAFETVKSFVTDGMQRLMDAAKAAWEAAAQKALDLKNAAIRMAGVLQTKVAGLKVYVQDLAARLATSLQQKWIQVKAWARRTYYAVTGRSLGSMMWQTEDVKFDVTNPESMGIIAASGNVTVGYVPTNQNRDGRSATEQEQTPLYVLNLINENREQNINAYGASTIRMEADTSAFDRAGIGIGIKDLFMHGSSGFLEDCTSGQLELDVKVGDFDMEFVGDTNQQMSDIVSGLKNAFVGKDGFQLPAMLPEGVTRQCGEAIQAIDYIFQRNTTLQEVTETAAFQVAELSTRESAALKQSVDDQALALKQELDAAQEEAMLAEQESEQASVALTEALEAGNAEHAEIVERERIEEEERTAAEAAREVARQIAEGAREAAEAAAAEALRLAEEARATAAREAADLLERMQRAGEAFRNATSDVAEHARDAFEDAQDLADDAIDSVRDGASNFWSWVTGSNGGLLLVNTALIARAQKGDSETPNGEEATIEYYFRRAEGVEPQKKKERRPKGKGKGKGKGRGN